MNKKDDPAPTRLAVTNSAGATTTITIGSETFSSVANGTTSTTREISFSSLSGVAVSCSGSVCMAGNVDLQANKDNTVTVSNTTGPTVTAITVMSGGGGGW